jgi:hypothetical protein
MGWQSWRFEGQAHESPHIFVFNMRQDSPVARLFILSSGRHPAVISVMAGLDPAIHVFGLRDPGFSLRSPGFRLKQAALT